MPPHLASPRAQMPGLTSGLGLRQLVEELAAFLGPPTSHFPGKDHKPCATPLPCELRVDPLLPTAGGDQSSPVVSRRTQERKNRHVSRLTRVWCPQTTVLPDAREAHQPQSPDSGCPNASGRAKSMSCTPTFTDILAPASENPCGRTFHCETPASQNHCH